MKHQVRYRPWSILLFSFLSGSSFTYEQQEIPQVLRDLRNDYVLLTLSAHPDDEDGATLAYYRMKFGVKTYSVFFTRGEGGQNEVGPELYEELGAIRTKEAERAAMILGCDVWFLNFYDFGYSKTATETLRNWGGRGEVFRRLVYAIRVLKPDVIITNHNTNDRHGHHQAVAVAAIEAFDAAADETFHSEQFTEEGVGPWQTKKLFFRVSEKNISPETHYDVANPVSENIQLHGESYAQLALRALSEHKTQGMDRIADTMNTGANTFYRLVRASSRFEADTLDLFGDIDLFRYVSAEVRQLRAEIVKLSSRDPRSMKLIQIAGAMNIASALLESDNLSTLENRLVSSWKGELNRFAQHLAGVRWRSKISDWLVVPGQRVELSVNLQAGQKIALDSVRLTLHLPNGWTWESSRETSRGRLKPKKEMNLNAQILVPRESRRTYPRAKHLYDMMKSRSLGSVVIAYSVAGSWFWTESPLRLEVAARHTLEVVPKKAFIGKSGLSFLYRLTNHGQNKTAGRIRVKTPRGWFAESSEFVIPDEDSSAWGTIRIRPVSALHAGVSPLVFDTDWSTDTVSVSTFPIEFPGNLNVGIVESYDNTLESALLQLGVKYQKLHEQDLRDADLSSFHTILIDMRAYQVRSDLVETNERVLNYVKDGGNLVVLYQKDIEWKSEYAPYPIELSRRRISDESAPVYMLDPDHPLLRYPNRIVEEDWEGWVQERGLYFPSSHAQEYRQLLACADPDEPRLKTGYLVADYGKGSYIYTSFSWYRQLREVHPGALRNFVNMVSYGLRESWRSQE